MSALRFFLSLSVLAAAPRADAADPRARVHASVATKGEIWVGQRVTLVVELFAPGLFSGAPAFDLPQVSGAVVMPPGDHPILRSETIGGVSYTVQRHELAVLSQRGGAVEIPGFNVRFEANEAFGKPVKAYTVTTPPVRFVAKVPPGAEKLATVVTTRGLTVHEKWVPEPGAAKVGAAFTRTITVEARDVPGMALPSFAFHPPEGLRAYPEPPEVSDRTERGELTGRRVETVTYVCERPGHYELPALVLAWWNPEVRALAREKLPARAIAVAAPPAAVPAPPPEPRPWWRWLGVGAVALAIGGIVWRFAPALVARWGRHNARAAESDHVHFVAFERACHSCDAHATYRALVAWLDRFATEPPVRTVEEFAARARDPQLTAELLALQDAVFKPGTGRPTGPRRELMNRVRLARGRLSHAVRARRRESALPPLNPT